MGLEASTAILARDFRKPAGLTHFLKGVVFNGIVDISGGQESYKLSSFALANCLVVLPEEQENAKAGAEVAIHLLP
jgi:molybdopterin molybdotransferase